jgi:hypothetical protein
MIEPSNSPPAALQRGEGRRPGRPGIGAIDVHKAADALLREGQRPTVERIRARVGRGSPNTIQPLLDDWWRTLAARIDAGPAALHRLPEPVLHIVEALWLQVLAEAQRRARDETSDEALRLNDGRRDLEVKSYVLTLREGELNERLRSQDALIERLRAELAAVTTLLRRIQAERDLAGSKVPKPVKRKRARQPTAQRSKQPSTTPKKSAGRQPPRRERTRAGPSRAPQPRRPR